MNITVQADKKILIIGGKNYPCVIGRNGYIAYIDGREGDGKTPLGTYALRYGYYRADRVTLPKFDLPIYPMREDDGWCDDSTDPAYNRPVRLPYPTSTEKLYRDSHVYDVIIVLGHNDNPPQPNMGSAIFLHVARGGDQPTAGCVAVSLEHMLEILPMFDVGAHIEIRE